MKELRFKAAGGVWRVLYAFDPTREGVLFAAGNKAGMSQNRFYEQIISKSDKRYERHLKTLEHRGVNRD